MLQFSFQFIPSLTGGELRVRVGGALNSPFTTFALHGG